MGHLWLLMLWLLLMFSLPAQASAGLQGGYGAPSDGSKGVPTGADWDLHGQGVVEGAYSAGPVMRGAGHRSLQQSGAAAGRVVGWGSMQIANFVPDVLQQGATDIAHFDGGLDRIPVDVFLALLKNGSVVKWGGLTGEVSFPANGTSNVTAIAAAARSAIVLLSNGTVLPLNDVSTYGIMDSMPAVLQKDVDHIWSGGDFPYLARLRNTSFVAFGYGPDAQVTNPETSSTDRIVSVAAGLTLWANGSVIPENGASLLPKVLQSNTVIALAGSPLDPPGDTILALLSNGSIVQWSYTFPDKLPTVQLPFNSTGQTFTGIAWPNWGITATGAVKAWGSLDKWGDWDYQNLTDISSTLPNSVQDGVQKIVYGYGMSLALKKPGPFNVVGFNGQAIGPASASIPSGVGTAIVTQVAAGRAHAMALQSDGRVVVWGDNSKGQLAVPQTLVSGGVKQVAAAQDYCIAVTLQGELFVWGSPPPNSTLLPTEVRSNVKSVAAGDACFLALLNNGSVTVWGNTEKLLPLPAALMANVSGVAVVAEVYQGDCSSAVAVLNNGSMIQWGANSAQVENVSQAAVSEYCTAAVLKNGSLVLNSSIPTRNITEFQDLSHKLNVQRVALGDFVPWEFRPMPGTVGLVLLTNGTLIPVPFDCYQPDICIEHVIPSAAQSGVIDMAIGGSFSLALTTEGTSPTPTGPTVNATQSGTISFVLGMSATSNLTTNNTLEQQFGEQLRAAMAAYFNVSSVRVGLNVSINGVGLNASAQSQSTGRQQAPLPMSRLLQASISEVAQVRVPVNITATWQAGDTTTPAFLQQQVSQLQQHPAAALPAALVKAYNIDTSTVTITALSVSRLLQPPTPASAPTPGPTPGPAGLASPNPVSPSPGLVAGTPSPSSSSKLGKGTVAGITVGCVIATAAVAALVGVMYRRYRGASAIRRSGTQPSSGGFEGVATPTEAVKIAGLPEGELFVLATAQNYTWIEAAALSGFVQAIEAGINDTQLDKMLQQDVGDQQAAAPLYCPAVQLSKDELCQQVQLLSDGLLGRGATALVFKCVWPSRFGPNALLAAKVLHNGFESDMSVLSSFAYEANLLAGIQHPHVVKLYGYCLDPPTVCLILELLPCSLKDVLYKAPPQATGSQTASGTASKSGSLPGAAEGTQFVTASAEQRNNDLNAAGGNEGDNRAYTTPMTADISRYVTAQVDFTVSCAAPLEAASSHAATSTTSNSHRSSTQSRQTATTSTSQTRSRSNVNEPTILPEAGALGVNSDGCAELKVNNSVALQSSVHPLKPVMLPQIIRMCTDIAAGLAYLHSQPAPTATVDGKEHLSMASSRDGRIVHRDMKPANILLNSHGVAKISDFGLARQHDHTTFATIHLGAGTLPYMAPELLISSKAGVSGAACTNRVDIYSLGIIMWELLMGQPPWKGMSAASVMAAVINRRRLPLPDDGQAQSEDREHAIMDIPALQPLPAHSHPDLPKMCQIIQACWQQRELRRPTAAALHGTLSALLQKLDQQPSTP